jgi:hypothetical protein
MQPPLGLPYAELPPNERRAKLIALTNTDTPEQLKAVDFRESVGSYELLDVQLEEKADYTVRVRYTVPLSWCHSFDPAKPIGKNEGDSNLPVAQGGLVGGLLDNAMSLAMRFGSGGRFVTTLSMTTEFLAPVRPGHAYAEARCTMVGGTVGFAVVTLFREEAMKNPICHGTSTNKLAKPVKRARL